MNTEIEKETSIDLHAYLSGLLSCYRNLQFFRKLPYFRLHSDSEGFEFLPEIVREMINTLGGKDSIGDLVIVLQPQGSLGYLEEIYIRGSVTTKDSDDRPALRKVLGQKTKNKNIDKLLSIPPEDAILMCRQLICSGNNLMCKKDEIMNIKMPSTAKSARMVI